MQGLIQKFQLDGFTFHWYYQHNAHYVQAGNTSFVGVGDSYHEAFQDMIDHAEVMKDEDEYFAEFEAENEICNYLLSYTKRNPIRKHDSSESNYTCFCVSDSGTGMKFEYVNDNNNN